jgi:hypothetical protein
VAIFCYTNAPTAYDYEGTVLVSAPLTERCPTGSDRALPFRWVEMTDLHQGYFADYQVQRYRSGGYLVLTPQQWEDWKRDGILVAPPAGS